MRQTPEDESAEWGPGAGCAPQETGPSPGAIPWKDTRRSPSEAGCWFPGTEWASAEAVGRGGYRQIPISFSWHLPCKSLILLSFNPSPVSGDKDSVLFPVCGHRAVRWRGGM